MRPTQVLATVLAFSSLSAAWPWPSSLDDIKALTGFDGVLNGVLDRRQNNNNDKTSAHSPAPSPTPKPSPTKPTPSPTGPGKGHSKTTATKSKGSSKPTQKPLPKVGYAGGVNMIQPAVSLGSQYYRVDTTVTWVWNYTSLLRTPSQIDILATVAGSALGGIAPSPFTLALNQSWEKTQTFTWDTGKYYTETSRLPVGTYTLQVYDANSPGGATGQPSPGLLAPFDQFYFGMYTPTPYYAPNPEFQCITCNAAGGKMERLTLGFLAGTVVITMASFLWFAGVAGVLF